MALYETIVNNSFPFDVFIQDNLKSAVNVTEHFHDCFEILYVITGSAYQKIDRNAFWAHKGSFVLIKSGNIHSTYCKADEDTKIFVLKFLPSVIDSGYFKLESSQYIAAFLNKQSKEFSNLDEEKQNELKQLLVEMLNEFEGKPKAYDIRIKGLIFQLLSMLIRFEMITIPEKSLKEYELQRLDRVLKYIEEHYKEKLTLSEISSVLNMNYSYVSRYFKKITGRNFKDYLDYIRICEAEKQIMLKNRFIYQIAAECGFTCVESFNRVYKRVKGVTPTELKK